MLNYNKVFYKGSALYFFFQKREGPDDMGATAIVEIDTEADKDSRAIFEKQQEINKVTTI